MYEAIARALKEKRNLLEPEALKLFTDFELPVPIYKFASTIEEAVAASAEIGHNAPGLCNEQAACGNVPC